MSRAQRRMEEARGELEELTSWARTSPRWRPLEATLRARLGEVDAALGLPSLPASHWLRVPAECAWFELDDVPRVDLSQRDALRLLLRALVEAHPRRLSVTELVPLGWPGERIEPAAAASRVYVGVRTLRGLGLEPVLVTDASGYGLREDAYVDVVS